MRYNSKLHISYKWQQEHRAVASHIICVSDAYYLLYQAGR